MLYCCGRTSHWEPVCCHRNENCSTCSEKRHTSKVCQPGQSPSASASAVESDDMEEDQIKEVHDVCALVTCTSTEPMVHDIGDDNLIMILIHVQRNTCSPKRSGNVSENSAATRISPPAQRDG